MTGSVIRSSFLAVFSMLMVSSADCARPFGKSVMKAYAGNVNYYVHLNNQHNEAHRLKVKGKDLHRQNIGKRTVAETKNILLTGQYTGDGNFMPVAVNPVDYREIHVYDSLNGGIGEVNYATNRPTAVQALINPGFKTEYSFVRENSGEAAVGFYHKPNGKIAVLNFGNAIKRCGGFLNGRGAQEESLSRISMLSASIMRIAADNMYYNYNYGLLCNGLMSRRVILSPNSLIFRTDKTGEDWKWLKKPVPVSVVTASAFDEKQYRDIQRNLVRNVRDHGHRQPAKGRKHGGTRHAAGSGSKTRAVPTSRAVKENTKALIRNSLLAAAHNGCETFLLGAFGCGVCAQGEVNKDAVYRRIARYFREVLVDEGLGSYFKKIVFPIVDDNIRNIFNAEFGNARVRITNSRIFGRHHH